MRRLALAARRCLALPVATADAWVAPGAAIVSASLELREQGDEASGNAAISADGRYVVFETRARNLFPPTFADPPGAHWQGGVMRRDLATGALDLVAPGDLIGDVAGEVQVRGARNGSVSADGRFVAFSTAQKLLPEDVNGNIDVYVRDMATGAYELISARDGTTQPAGYATRDPDTPGRNPGADVSPGVAISADGDRVLFRTVDIGSDLPDRLTTETPPYQLFVRVRSTRRTLLMTRDQQRRPGGRGAHRWRAQRGRQHRRLAGRQRRRADALPRRRVPRPGRRVLPVAPGRCGRHAPDHGTRRARGVRLRRPTTPARPRPARAPARSPSSSSPWPASTPCRRSARTGSGSCSSPPRRRVRRRRATRSICG